MLRTEEDDTCVREDPGLERARVQRRGRDAEGEVRADGVLVEGLGPGLGGVDLREDFPVWEDESGLLGVVVADGAVGAVQDRDSLEFGRVGVEDAAEVYAMCGLVPGFRLVLPFPPFYQLLVLGAAGRGRAG